MNGHKNNKEAYCPNMFFDNGTVSIGEFITLDDAMNFPIKEIWCINRTEDNDRYFTVQTRLQYALDFNPDFIISIHINSIANKNYTGTMVLYSNNDNESDYGDITSKECAQIVVNELCKALDTVNRGVVERNDLHILRDTPCPSVLCEVCFISNDAELERLKTKSFQQDAAQAMYEGIEKILKEM